MEVCVFVCVAHAGVSMCTYRHVCTYILYMYVLHRYVGVYACMTAYVCMWDCDANCVSSCPWVCMNVRESVYVCACEGARERSWTYMLMCMCVCVRESISTNVSHTRQQQDTVFRGSCVALTLLVSAHRLWFSVRWLSFLVTEFHQIFPIMLSGHFSHSNSSHLKCAFVEAYRWGWNVVMVSWNVQCNTCCLWVSSV